MLEYGTIVPGKFSLRIKWYQALTWLCFYNAPAYVYQKENFSYVWPLHGTIPVFLLRNFLEVVIIDLF